FDQAVGMLAPGGTMSLVGLPPGEFPLPIFDVVLNRKTIRGSIVGTRADLAEALAFAGEGKVATHYSVDRLDNINSIFDRLLAGQIDGRIVMSV
ncbi:MAG: zinc-binding dehydrogenase, partial [Pseudomonadota bacterium]